MDVYEEKGNLVVKTELPGIESKDLDVKLEGDTITIKAEKKEEVKEDATHHTSERYYGRYYRSVKLPFPVKEDSISASLEKGVLEITLPKAEAVEAKKIEVKAQLPRERKKVKKEK
jgi:HSP20 family protein